jgi:hypothetical protein
MASWIAAYLNMKCMKAPKGRRGTKYFFMKRTLLIITALFITTCSRAQENGLTFPFQGGSAILTRFFKDSLVISPDIIQQRATGVAVFKFTADDKGKITKIIIAYADDYVLTPPIIEALRKSNHKWIIPDQEKLHDFIITFTINYNPPPAVTDSLQKQHYTFYQQRRPILSTNQVPLDDATLLPTIVVNYDLQ